MTTQKQTIAAIFSNKGIAYVDAFLSVTATRTPDTITTAPSAAYYDTVEEFERAVIRTIDGVDEALEASY